MRISDASNRPEVTQRVTFDVDGEPCFIEVRSTSSREYSNGLAWFKRVAAQRAHAGVDLIRVVNVAGEEVEQKTEEYQRLEAILFAHLIADWGFDDELTLDSAAKLVIANSDIRELIDETTSLIAYAEKTAKKPQQRTQEQS